MDHAEASSIVHTKVSNKFHAKAVHDISFNKYWRHIFASFYKSVYLNELPLKLNIGKIRLKKESMSTCLLSMFMIVIVARRRH